MVGLKIEKYEIRSESITQNRFLLKVQNVSQIAIGIVIPIP